MNYQLVADLINKVTNHRTKVTVGQVEALANAIAADVKLAQELTLFIDNNHGWSAFPHLPQPEEQPAQEEQEAEEPRAEGKE